MIQHLRSISWTLGALQTFLLVAVISCNEDFTEKNMLYSDRQTSTFIKGGEIKNLFYWSNVSESSLSITVTPCTAKLHWSIYYSAANDTSKESKLLYDTEKEGLKIMYTWTSEQAAIRGLYTVRIAVLGLVDSAVHVYVSTERGGPRALHPYPPPRLRLQRRQRNDRLAVKWNMSAVNPHTTSYCLVVSTSRNYSSLCEAEAESHATIVPNMKRNTGKLPFRSARISRGKEDELLVACVGQRSQFIITHLEHGRIYYFNLFAVDRQTNLTFPYGVNVLRFDKKLKPIILKDAKSTFANLKKTNGKAVLRYKVSEKLARELLIYIVPCGGAVDVEVTLQGERVVTRRRIDGYGRLIIKAPIAGQRYYIRVISSNTEELRRISGVEILATTKPGSKFPFPTMPTNTRVHFYSTSCDTVIVGWLVPEAGYRSSHKSKHVNHNVQQYCVYAREGRVRETEGFVSPDQCSLDTRLKKSTDFVEKYCQNIKLKDEKEEVVTQKISQLKPGRTYVIQVTVSKQRGKALSYNLLQIQTKPNCKHNNTFDQPSNSDDIIEDMKMNV